MSPIIFLGRHGSCRRVCSFFNSWMPATNVHDRTPEGWTLPGASISRHFVQPRRDSCRFTTIFQTVHTGIGGIAYNLPLAVT